MNLGGGGRSCGEKEKAMSREGEWVKFAARISAPTSVIVGVGGENGGGRETVPQERLFAIVVRDKENKGRTGCVQKRGCS